MLLQDAEDIARRNKGVLQFLRKYLADGPASNFRSSVRHIYLKKNCKSVVWILRKWDGEIQDQNLPSYQI